jgi:two-component system, chemotaxis family, CheB/CheR fusion protein
MILNISESAGRYLVHPGGPVTNHLLHLVRPELQTELRSALFQAFEKGKSSVSTPLRVHFDGKMGQVVITVRPDNRNAERNPEPIRRALVSFMEDESATEVSQGGTESQPVQPSSEMLQQLEGEVLHLRARLQSSLEEFNSSNEEMKAANEELQSVNEEYRSTMEELETSKEELQSVNEELQTVNSELRNNVEEISRAHSDLENLMDATQIATLFLDRDLKIKRYSPGMEKLFNIKPTDRGRSISDFTHKLGYQDLVEDASTVLDDLVTIERESTGPDNRSMLIRLLPYRTMDKRIDGVVISFVDITEVKNAEHARQNYESFYKLFHASPVPTLLIRQDDRRIINANAALLDYLALKHDHVLEHDAGEFNLALDRETNELSVDGSIRNFEKELLLPSGETRSILVSTQPTYIHETDAALITLVDITERVKAEQEIHRLNIERKMVEHQERQRIAQMLHDDLQQRLFALKLYLNNMNEESQREGSGSGGRDLLKPVEWLGEAITLTRQLTTDLSPFVSLHDGLVFGLLALSSQMKELYGLDVELNAANFQLKFEEGLQLTLFQTVRELLFNVVKHSGSSKATVIMEQIDQDWAQISVRDEGIGFDFAAFRDHKKRGRGLRSVQQELKVFGCKLEVDSRENAGTRMIIHIPVGDAAARP